MLKTRNLGLALVYLRPRRVIDQVRVRVRGQEAKHRVSVRTWTPGLINR